MNRDQEQALADAVARVDRQQAVTLIAETARIKSYSGDERQIADYMAQRLATLGLEVERQEVVPGRCNVIGRWRGHGDGPSVMFNGHMDTNPAGEGWTKDPLAGYVDDSFVYGIGVSNMKAANGSFLHAVETLKASGYKPGGDIVLAYVVGELQGGIGTKRLIQKGVKSDYFIVGEPTDLSIVTCHAASFVFKIHVHGQTRHLSKREEGVDAIAKMLGVLQHLSTFKFSGATTPEAEGLSRVNVGVIRGGMTKEYYDWRPQQLADICTIKCAGRFGPGQTLDGAMADLQRLLNELHEQDPQLDARLELVTENRIFMPPFHVDKNCAPARALFTAHRQLFGSEPRIGDVAPYKFLGSDAAHLAEAGMTGVVMGPGGRYNTMPDERVDIADIVAASKLYVQATAVLNQGRFSS